MIRKVVIIDEDTWNRLTFEIAKAIVDQCSDEYGFTIYRNEDGEAADSLDEVLDRLTPLVSRAVDRLTKGEA